MLVVAPRALSAFPNAAGLHDVLRPVSNSHDLWCVPSSAKSNSICGWCEAIQVATGKSAEGFKEAMPR
jgi:hypothetical protein